MKKKDVMIDALDLFDACNDNVLPEESPELHVKEEEESEAFNEISWGNVDLFVGIEAGRRLLKMAKGL